MRNGGWCGGMKSELRVDPITNDVVLISPVRSERPVHLQAVSAPISRHSKPSSDSTDPFLEGNEQLTESESLAIRMEGSLPNTPGWLVRCISNRYPAVFPWQEFGNQIPQGEELLSIVGSNSDLDRARQAPLAGIGLHDVVVECPHDETHLSRLSIDQIGLVISLWRDRLRAYMQDEHHWQYGLIFKNHGRLAGASLPHSHSQMMALPFVPPRLLHEFNACRAAFKTRRDSLWSQLIEQEELLKLRVVQKTSRFLAVTPYASRFPFELRVLPLKAQAHFSSITDDDCEELATLLKRLLIALETVAHDPDYNLVIHTAPLHEQEPSDFHWRLEILPRMGGIAGFEWGTGGFINAVPPEIAAAQYREALS